MIREDGQGLRSRVGQLWPPGLEGPDHFTDTMDVAGPLGPAWTRRTRSATVTPFVDILREGVRVPRDPDGASRFLTRVWVINSFRTFVSSAVFTAGWPVSGDFRVT